MTLIEIHPDGTEEPVVQDSYVYLNLAQAIPDLTVIEGDVLITCYGGDCLGGDVNLSGRPSVASTLTIRLANASLKPTGKPTDAQRTAKSVAYFAGLSTFTIEGEENVVIEDALFTYPTGAAANPVNLLVKTNSAHTTLNITFRRCGWMGGLIFTEVALSGSVSHVVNATFESCGWVDMNNSFSFSGSGSGTATLNAVFRNCAALGTDTGLIFNKGAGGLMNIEVYNSILYNGTGVGEPEIGDIDVRYSLIAQSDYMHATNKLIAEDSEAPIFENQHFASSDFSWGLASGSSAVGFGDSDEAPTLDYYSSAWAGQADAGMVQYSGIEIPNRAGLNLTSQYKGYVIRDTDVRVGRLQSTQGGYREKA